ncbi:trigger factor [Chloroflexota bacterium]
MKVTRGKTENCQMFLKVEMEPEEVEKSLEASFHRLAQKVKIPGFRKGKMPRVVLERHIGKESLLEDALNQLVPEAYKKALNEQEIEAIGSPNIEILQTDPTIIFEAVVPLPPKIELGDYHQIRLTPDPVEATEDNVHAVIEGLRHQHSIWEPIERPLDFGDLIVLNIESDTEGQLFINQHGVQYQVVRGSSSPAPGFAEQLVGMGKGENKEFKLKLPEDYPKTEFAGKEASFKVDVVEIKEEKLPELSDEFAKQVSPDFETSESLREQVANNLKARAEEKVKIDFENRVIEEVAGLSQTEFPPILVEMEIDRLLNEQAKRLRMDEEGLQEYLKSVNKTKEELREELRPMAAKRTIHSLVLGKVAEEEKVEIGDSEIEAEIQRVVNTVAQKDELQKLLASSQSKESIRYMLMTQKTITRLVEIAGNPDKPKRKKKEAKK